MLFDSILCCSIKKNWYIQKSKELIKWHKFIGNNKKLKVNKILNETLLVEIYKNTENKNYV